MEELC